MSDWDAARYNRVSDPQFEWGRRVIARLAPRPRERILDLGCGTGRLTAEITALVPDGCVVGLDRSEAMLKVARETAPALASPGRAPVHYIRGDGVALPFAAAFDAVFSAATLHWIADHPALFRSVLATLRPGGRLVAQCGGGRNLERLYRRAAGLMHATPFSVYFGAWEDPWHFASARQAREDLARAGFMEISVWLEATPIAFPDADTYGEFISCVCVRHHLERLPQDLHRSFVSELAVAAGTDKPPLTLDYWRLNIDAVRRPA